MKRASLAVFALALATTGVQAQQDPAPALNHPDMISWQLFALVSAPAASQGNNNVLFETWASDGDTFRNNPVCPLSPTPMILHAPVLAEFAPVRPGLRPHVLPSGKEETRRNKVTFDFIVNNNLFTRTGLAATFAAGKEISFPVELDRGEGELGCRQHR